MPRTIDMCEAIEFISKHPEWENVLDGLLEATGIKIPGTMRKLNETERLEAKLATLIQRGGEAEAQEMLSKITEEYSTLRKLEDALARVRGSTHKIVYLVRPT